MSPIKRRARSRRGGVRRWLLWIGIVLFCIAILIDSQFAKIAWVNQRAGPTFKSVSETVGSRKN